MAVLNVPSTAYPTIQSAVNAASPGDTILIAAGTFTESVTIPCGKNRLNIVGAGRHYTFVQGATGLIIGFDITGSVQVSLSHLTVQGFTGTGVVVATNSNVIHSVKSMNNGAAGFSVSGLGNLLIDDEAEANLTDGFDLTGPKNYLLRSESERNRVYGVFVSAAGNLLFLNCIEGSGSDGVNLDTSCANTIAFNEVKDSGADGINLAGSTGNTVFENEICDTGTTGATPAGNGIAVSTSVNIVDHNEVCHSVLAGILLAATAANNAIRQNHLRANTPDIQVLAPAGANVLDLNTCATSSPSGLCTAPPNCP